MSNRRNKDLMQLALGLLILIGLNVLATKHFKRFDLTAEKRFSLSDSTKAILRRMDDVALISVYLEGKDFPVGFKRLQNATRELLDEFRFYAGNKIQYRFIDPFSNEDKQVQADIYYELVDKGLLPTDLTVKDEKGRSTRSIFPGAIIAYNGREEAVQLLQSQFNQNPEFVLNQSIERLEYEFSKALYKLLNFEKKKNVAFSRGHGEINELYLADFIMGLREFYEVEGIEIGNNLDVINQTTSCLIIAQPDSAFSDASKFIIDQYIMRGGKVLWLLDQVFVSMDSMRNANYTLGIPRDLNLYDQLFRYGVRVNPTLVLDAQCSPIPIITGKFGNQDKQEFLPWYYYPVIIPESKHPIVKNLNSIKLEFANTLDTIAVPGVNKTILLTTSQLTKVLYAPVRISLNVVEQEPTAQRFNKPHQPVAVLLEGQFRSAFENKIVELSNRTVKKESEPTKMIVIGDGDIAKNFYNPKTKNIIPLGLDPRTGIYYGGNKNFLLNCVNYLTGDSWFIPLRSKEYRIRLLDKNKVTEEKQKWKLMNTVIPVIWVVVFGLLYNYIRKRKYAV